MQNEKYSNTRFWDECRNVIRTQKGGWVIGKDVTIQGFSLLEDLLGQASFIQVYILNVTGKLPEPRLAKWLEAIFLCGSSPDPRIWCNQIGSLGGTVRTSPVGAICAGTLASDSRMYGPGTAIIITSFIASALKKKNEGKSIEHLIEKQGKGLGQQLRIPGYARPFTKVDERVEAMKHLAKTLGYSTGPHLEVAYEIHDYLYEHYGESMNLSGYIAAFLMDQGFSSNEIYRICSLGASSGVHACFSEAADREPESFLPWCCEDVEYCGVPEREIPVELCGK